MSENNYDVIIIGSGAGAAAAAYALVNAGRRVLVLEKEGYLPKDGSTLDVKQVFKEGRFKNQQPWADSQNRPFTPDEFYNVGGKTKWYGAALLRFSPHEFEPDPEYQCLGWPIAYSDLAPYYDQAESLMAVTRFDNEPGLQKLIGRILASDPAWRARTIYDTNLFTSYSAGRTRQMKEVARTRPYWRYRHSPASRVPRAEHLAWDGIILRHDDPWWKTHTPPNGFGCKCYVETLAERDLKREGLELSNPEQIPYPDSGVDKGWNYQPGADQATPLYDLIARKVPNLPAPLGAAMWDSLKGALAMEQQLKLWGMIDQAKKTRQAAGQAVVVHGIDPVTVQALADLEVELQSAEVWLRDAQLIHALRDAKAQRGAELPESVWRELPSLLERATPYLDTVDQALAYAFDAPDGVGKVVVRVNYTEKLRDGEKRVRVTTNFIRTAGMVSKSNLAADRYQELTR